MTAPSRAAEMNVRNCLILGSGRSGTSMTAGLLSDAGYYFGSQLLRASSANPKGFFEDKLVNRTNELILSQEFRFSRLPKWPARLLGRGPFFRGQLWLAVLDRPVQWQLADVARRNVDQLTAHRPFAFKDPRFSYTLNAWRPYLPDCRFVCVFRDPAATTASIMKFAAENHPNLKLTRDHALRVWIAMYRQILEFHCHDISNWLFVEFQTVLDGTAHEAIGAFLEAGLNGEFVDPRLNRSRPTPLPFTREADEIYLQLKEYARLSQEKHLSTPTLVGT